MAQDNGFFGQRDPTTEGSDWNALRFVVQQALNQIQTMTLVRVVAVSNAGGAEPVGTVDVQPLVNQITGDRVAVPHGVVYGLPYFRLQGGANAIILDPQVGDIGICGFANRDISSVKASKAEANPGSFRTFDFADGLYLGGVLNGTPAQYVQFNASGIAVTTPGTVVVNASAATINASTTINGNLTVSGTIGAGGKISAPSVNIAGIEFGTHKHTGVATGGSNTGGPTS